MFACVVAALLTLGTAHLAPAPAATARSGDGSPPHRPHDSGALIPATLWPTRNISRRDSIRGSELRMIQAWKIAIGALVVTVVTSVIACRGDRQQPLAPSASNSAAVNSDVALVALVTQGQPSSSYSRRRGGTVIEGNHGR